MCWFWWNGNRGIKVLMFFLINFHWTVHVEKFIALMYFYVLIFCVFFFFVLAKAGTENSISKELLLSVLRSGCTTICNLFWINFMVDLEWNSWHFPLVSLPKKCYLCGFIYFHITAVKSFITNICETVVWWANGWLCVQHSTVMRLCLKKCLKALVLQQALNHAVWHSDEILCYLAEITSASLIQF